MPDGVIIKSHGNYRQYAVDIFPDHYSGNPGDNSKEIQQQRIVNKLKFIFLGKKESPDGRNPVHNRTSPGSQQAEMDGK